MNSRKKASKEGRKEVEIKEGRKEAGSKLKYPGNEGRKEGRKEKEKTDTDTTCETALI